MISPDEILTFWFVEHGMEDWFGAKPEFDALIAERFTETFESAARGETWRWRTTRSRQGFTRSTAVWSRAG